MEEGMLMHPQRGGVREGGGGAGGGGGKREEEDGEDGEEGHGGNSEAAAAYGKDSSQARAVLSASGRPPVAVKWACDNEDDVAAGCMKITDFLARKPKAKAAAAGGDDAAPLPKRPRCDLFKAHKVELAYEVF